MCEAMLETQPEFFKPRCKQFRYILSYSYPVLPDTNYAISEHCSGRHCHIRPSKHWHVLLFSDDPFDPQLGGYKVPCPYTAFRLLIHSTNMALKGEIFEKLKTAVEYHKLHPESGPKELDLKKKLPKVPSVVNRITQTTHVTQHFLDRVLAVADGRYSSEFNTVIDALISGYGHIETISHGVRLSFALEPCESQCTCWECLG